MIKPRLEDIDKVATVYNSKGEVCETFSFRDHGNSYLSAAQNYLMQNYDKLMSESTNDYFRDRNKKEKRIAGERDKHGAKLPPLRKPKQTDYEKMRKKQKEQGLDEEVEQIDERENSPYERASDRALDREYGYGTSYDKGSKTSFGRSANRNSAAAALRLLRKNKSTDTEVGADAVHRGWAKTATTSIDQTPEKKEKRAVLARTPYSKLPEVEKEKDRVAFRAVRSVYDKNEAKTKSENKIYTNVIAKLEEGRRPTPPKEGKEPSAAWKRYEERQKASGGTETEKKKEPEHVAAQLLKHQDYGYKDHEYTFHDGSTLNVTPQQRDRVMRKIQSSIGPGPGKSPDVREKLYNEINTKEGFLRHAKN